MIQVLTVSPPSPAPVPHRGREEADRHADQPDAAAGQQLVSVGTIDLQREAGSRPLIRALLVLV